MMKLLRELSPQLALAGIVALQLSCGDSSGPGRAASSIAANSPTATVAAPGTQVSELPSVIVRDESGNPISGVHVTFAVTGGGGSVTSVSAMCAPRFWGIDILARQVTHLGVPGRS